MDKTNEKKTEKMTEKVTEKAVKAKKEKKFNSERISKQAKAALKAVFPNEAFIVSSLVERVKVLYPIASKITPAEINTFKAVFCTLTQIKKEEITFGQYEEKVA